MIKLFTIGFTRKSAQQFFETLGSAEVTTLIDTRLHNTSQLSGFAKHKDLEYFLTKIANINYCHNLNLAPTQDILDAYKKKQISWAEYAKQYIALLEKRQIALATDPSSLQNSCFLCSENKPHFCHRRIAAEYFQSHFTDIEIIHL